MKTPYAGGAVSCLAAVYLMLSNVSTVLADSYTLGATNRVEGPTAGTDSVALAVSPPAATWTASANAPWLHTVAGGTGSTNVPFSFDANAGATRTGTLTIASQTVTIIQAGSTYVAANPLVTLASSGLDGPAGVAVDGARNVYIADVFNSAIKKWNAVSNTVTTLVSSGLNQPYGVAVDSTGNVYIADTFNNAIKKWNVVGGAVTTLVSSGLNHPGGVAVDTTGNVYIADTQNNAIKRWNVAGGTVTTLVSSGLNQPNGVAVDGAGNVYIVDTFNNAIKKWRAVDSTVITLVSSGLNQPEGVAVDGAGHVYVADTINHVIKKWNAPDGTVTTLVASGLSNPFGVAADGAGNVYVADPMGNTVKEAPRAWVDATAKTEPMAAGSDALPVVLPATQNLSGPFAPTSNQSWLTIAGVANGVVNFLFTDNMSVYSRVANITLLGKTVTVTQAGATIGLGFTNRVEGPAAGTDSVVLAVSPPMAWTGTANDSWLHLTTTSGTGSTNVLYRFDANSGATRTGTLTVAGRTITITQAGSTYVPANPLVTLVASGLREPYGVAVDGTGNVYIADTMSNAIKRCNVAGGAVTTLVSSGLNQPFGVAVDGAGNVYIADSENDAIKKWNVADGTVTTLVSSGLNNPLAVAADGTGNVYVADTFNNAIKKWNVVDGTVTTLVSSGLNQPRGVAVDGLGNVYIADCMNNAIKKWKVAGGTVTTLVSSGLNLPSGVAVDGAGDVYIANNQNNAIEKWKVADGTVTTLVWGLRYPNGVAVDGAGNVYIADTMNHAIKEVPRAFVDPTAKSETAAAGSDALPVVLPATQNLSGPFTPTSDQSWLTIAGVANGVVNFNYTQNTGTVSRTAHITLLGQTVTVVQAHIHLGFTNRVEGPAAGTDSVVLAVSPPMAWTGTVSGAWLHLITTNGTGSTNVLFRFDANSGATRTGTLTIAGQTLTLTQAGSTYVPASPLTTLLSGLNLPYGVAADATGNVYIADTFNNAIKKWNVVDGAVTTLVSAGLNYPGGVAVDTTANVYIADTQNSAIKKWNVAGGAVTTVVSTGLNKPEGVAADATGNVYIADTFNNAIKKWNVADGTVTSLVSAGLYQPNGVAVDGAGNVYLADTLNHAIKRWNVAGGAVTTLVSTGLSNDYAVAVDGAGHVYIADTHHHAIKKWNAADATVTTLVSSGLSYPYGVAVDGAGNVYVADTMNNAIKEVPRAFVDPTARTEPAAAGSDALPVVLPVTQNLSGPFTPTSDQPWLTIAGVNNGVVSFNFTENTGLSNRTAHIALLGKTTTITQYGVPSMAVLGTNGAMIASGEAAGAAQGTDFAGVSLYSAVTNRLAVTNAGGSTLTISGWTTNGAGAAQFAVLDVPRAVEAGTVSNFSLVFRPTVVGVCTAVVELANNSTSTPYRLCVAGTGLTVNCTITIVSAYGEPVPARGSHTNPVGTVLTNSVSSPDALGATQYVCVGWRLTGHDPVDGVSTQFIMTVTNTATLTWQWATNYWLETAAGPNGSVQPEDGWQSFGSNVTVTAIKDPYYHFTNWTGSVPGGNEHQNPLIVLMDGPKSIQAQFAENTTVRCVPEWWLASHGLTNGGYSFEDAALRDTDYDGAANWEEYWANTDPTNALSVMRLTQIHCSMNPAGIVVSWTGGVDRSYFLSCSTNSGASWSNIAVGLNSLSGSYTDTVDESHSIIWYRVGVPADSSP